MRCYRTIPAVRHKEKYIFVLIVHIWAYMRAAWICHATEEAYLLVTIPFAISRSRLGVRFD